MVVARPIVMQMPPRISPAEKEVRCMKTTDKTALKGGWRVIESAVMVGLDALLAHAKAQYTSITHTTAP
jgi:hypothetical protein